MSTGPSQLDEEAVFSIRFVSSDIDRYGIWLSLAGTVLIWLGIGALVSRRPGISTRVIIGAIAVSGVLLIGSLGFLGSNPLPASLLAMLIGILAVAWWSVSRILVWRRGNVPDQAA